MGIPVYRTERNPDGTVTIFDVPIFSAHDEKRGEEELSFNASWLAGALKAGTQRQEEGYLPPLHVRHHGDGSPVEAAGKFRVTRVGTIEHGGKLVPTIYADLVSVRPQVDERIKKGELSYRSVEILDVNKQEIDSLALLDDEVPFFRFPLLRVAESVEPLSNDTRIVTLAQGGPILAYSQAGASRQVLSRYKETTMADLKGNAPATDPSFKMAGLDAVKAALMQAIQALQALEGAQQAPAPGQPAEQPAPAMAAAPAAPMPPQQAKPFAADADESVKAEAEGTQAALLARMANMEAEIKANREQRTIDAKATELVGAGFGSTQVDAYRAKAKESGVTVAAAYAAGLAHVGPSDPPSHWTGEIRAQAVDHKDVEAFAAQGPEALARARDLHASFLRSAPAMSFNEYVAANTDADAFLGMTTR